MNRARLSTLRLAAGVAILALVVAGLDAGRLLGLLAAVDLRLAVPAVAGLTAMHLVAALGWREILDRCAAVRLPVGATVRSYYAAQALGGLTPANLGGDIYRSAALRAAGHGWAAAVEPILVQRASSYVALSLLGLAAAALLSSTMGGVTGLVLLSAAASVAVGAAALSVIAAPRWAEPIRRRIARVPREQNPTHPRALAAATGIGLVSGLLFHGGSICLTWLLVASVEPSAAGPALLAALAVARLALAVPISPSGIGVQEAALAAMLGSLGLPAAAAVAGLLLARVALLATTGLGVALIAAGRAGVPRQCALPTEATLAGRET